MCDEIDSRFRSNLARVRALVAVYQERAGAGSGRRDVQTIDLLRASVVFLHATMEDVLRSMLAWKWPHTTSRGHLEDIEIPVGSDLKKKVTLADLLPHRGFTVDDVIRTCIEKHLEKSNFNNLGEVKTALDRSGLDKALVNPFAPELAAMMARRHQIVHRRPARRRRFRLRQPCGCIAGQSDRRALARRCGALLQRHRCQPMRIGT